MKTRLEFARSAAFLLLAFAACSLPILAQVNSGSDGFHGAFRPTADSVIDMNAYSDGVFRYTEVNIPIGVRISFIPNASSTSVIWLVQSNCTIAGVVDVSGRDAQGNLGDAGGPGGFRGGNYAAAREAGVGPGGGKITDQTKYAGNGSFGTLGEKHPTQQNPPGDVYGNVYLFPLNGGSGGGGPGGGGGGAILIAASGTITVDGEIVANGGYGVSTPAKEQNGGGGSGGAIRLVATRVEGGGRLNAYGGAGIGNYNGGYGYSYGGDGRIRIDALADHFTGSARGVTTRGFQPLLLPSIAEPISLRIESIASISVAKATGAAIPPDVIVPGLRPNPVEVIVTCVNVPLNSEIAVEAKTASGNTITGVGINNKGTKASSTAVVLMNLPKGAGTIQAKARSGVTGAIPQ